MDCAINVIILIFLRLLGAANGKVSEFDSGQGTTWQFSSTDSLRDTPSKITEDLPIIVWWTENIYPHINSFENLHCPNSKCYTTNQKRFAQHNQTKVLYFYGSEFDPADLPLPRKPSHLWSLAHEESPLNNFVLDHSVAMNLFNYTATYHRAADFPITLLSFPSPEFILNRQPISTKLKTAYQEVRNLAPVAYVQSHCEVPSDRDRYIEELMKYIQIDSYGRCLHNKDLPEDLRVPVKNMFDKKFKDLLAQYKFILSFENGICNDYMTEKLFRTLHVGSVPVYRGSPYARDFVPDNHSIIMADDFESPKELAEFLLKLNKDDEEYEKYMEYKKRKTIENPVLEEMVRTRLWEFTHDDDDYGQFFEGFECYLCDRATERYENEKAHAADPSIPLIQPKLTDGRKFACPAPTPFREPEDPNDWWHLFSYTEQYWSGLDKARALRDMLAANETDSKMFSKYLKRYPVGQPTKL